MFKIFNPEYRHLKKAVKDAYKVIWETKYKRYASLLQREKERRNYDNLQSRMAVLDTQIVSQKEKPTMEEGDIKRLDDDKVRLQAEIDKVKERMKALDLEVSGSPATVEYPEGLAGLDHRIDAWHERIAVLKKYLKDL